MVPYFILKAVWWLLVSYGTTQILVESYLFMGFRESIRRRSQFFGELISCMLCSGTWVSALLSILIWSPSRAMFTMDVLPVHYTTLDGGVLHYVASGLFNIIEILRTGVFAYMDAMLGSTVIWFIHLIDNKLGA